MGLMGIGWLDSPKFDIRAIIPDWMVLSQVYSQSVCNAVFMALELKWRSEYVVDSAYVCWNGSFHVGDCIWGMD